ncbi:MAG TPA: shikimate dehydrogenase [Gemmatimonadales bacterium]|nr:shikimate dehydrogenase [Gemmatimonadales bacterium]
MASARTRVFAVLGDPVGHSLSPAMHDAAFRVLGIDAVYVALRCTAEDVPSVMRVLARQGGGGNVTVPHKSAAARAVTQPSELVSRLGACNTFWGDGAELAGDNTDVAGVLSALEWLGVPEGPWLVLGTGGSAHAVAAAAIAAGARLAVRSRDADRARDFMAWATGLGATPAGPEECVACINATPLGLGDDDAQPITCDEVPAARVALDLVYRPGETPWVHACRERGLRAADGREMLIAQGAAAFERWFPSKRAPVDAMRAAVHGRLG